MKVLLVILLIAGGIIYAGTRGAFKQYILENEVARGRQAEQAVNSNTVKQSDFKKANMNTEAAKPGEIAAAPDPVVSGNQVANANDESNPYSKHIDKKSTETTLDKKEKLLEDQDKTFAQKFREANSLGEVFDLLKETVIPKQEEIKKEEVPNAKDEPREIRIADDELLSSIPTDKDPLLQIKQEQQQQAQKEEKKQTLVVVLPTSSQTSEVDRDTGRVTVKNNSSSSSLLAVCKTKYPTSGDVRIINQVSTFNITTKAVESLTFEVECL